MACSLHYSNPAESCQEPHQMSDAVKPAQIIANMIDAGAAKARLPAGALFVRALPAGAGAAIVQ